MSGRDPSSSGDSAVDPVSSRSSASTEAEELRGGPGNIVARARLRAPSVGMLCIIGGGRPDRHPPGAGTGTETRDEARGQK